MTLFRDVAAFHRALSALPDLDHVAADGARKRQAQLTKPAGSLGRLEDIACYMAGWQGRERPSIDNGQAVVFAGNHGIVDRGVSAFPADVTVQMVANFEAGGAAINALAGAAGLDLRVIPLDLDRPTRDFTHAAAMDEEDCLAAINIGAASIIKPCDLLVLGEMGIGNSTSAAALAAVSFGGAASDWVGPGTGLDAEGVSRKIAVVDEALRFHADTEPNPFERLRRFAGREMAAIAGAVLAARLSSVPVMLDGFICCASIAPLAAIQPAILAHCLAGHCSAEPGHARLLDAFGLDPVLRLNMRLGEGSGAALAVGVVRAALAVHDRMATFAEAGVSGTV